MIDIRFNQDFQTTAESSAMGLSDLLVGESFHNLYFQFIFGIAKCFFGLSLRYTPHIKITLSSSAELSWPGIRGGQASIIV